jgi:hypothetical protein
MDDIFLQGMHNYVLIESCEYFINKRMFCRLEIVTYSIDPDSQKRIRKLKYVFYCFIELNEILMRFVFYVTQNCILINLFINTFLNIFVSSFLFLPSLLMHCSNKMISIKQVSLY